jgi:uncharacterized protein (TIGR00266 family)
MRYEIQYGPAYALAVVHLDEGERFRSEAGAMVTMSDTIRIETKGGGGLGSILRRSVLGGESLFMNDMVATRPDSRLTLAPALPGDIVGVEIPGGRDLLVQSGSYMASTADVNVDTQFGAGKTFFSGEGLFLLKLTGPGLTLLSSYGAIVPIELAAGESHIVDSGHIVAFDSGMGYEVKKAGDSWKTTLLGGEGLVCRITGPGRMWFQTRSPGGLIDWLLPRLPNKSSS